MEFSIRDSEIWFIIGLTLVLNTLFLCFAVFHHYDSIRETNVKLACIEAKGTWTYEDKDDGVGWYCAMPKDSNGE